MNKLADNKASGWPRLLRKLATENNTLSQLHNYRLQEQTNLTETNYDKIQLQHAIAHFTSLQEIKLLRLQDDPDEHLIDFIHHHYYHHNHNPHHNHNQLQHNPQFTIHLDWSPACTRAITNLSTALLDSKCSSIRFTAPQINPESTRQLLRTPTTTLAALASRLTSLDINFHSNTDNITPTMADLSGVFKRFFMAAKNLVAIHIGFLNKTPLDLHLEDLFHSIRWKTLRKLSIQGWRLSAGEIIDLVRRHRCQLREFRLVGIYLRPGGRWCDVLDVLRGEMEQLERIDLRDIDYAAYSDLVAGAHAGVEVFDDYTLPIQIHGPASSSVAVAAGAEGVQEVEGEGTSTPVDLGLAGPDGLGPTEVVYGKNGIFGRVTVERVLALGVEDLGDDGVHVLHEQMPLWEAWVLAGSVRARRLGRVHGWSM